MRRFIVGVLASGLVSFLLITALSTSVVTTFTGTNVKNWFKKHDVYQNLVDEFLEQNQDLNVGGSSSISLRDDGVQTALKKSFTPEFLQKITEQFIDGTEPWLKGKVAKPTFSIDVSGVKTTLAQNIGNYARDRYNSLPVCPRGQASSGDALTINCRLAGINIEPQIQQLVNDVQASKDFLPNTALTADNLDLDSKDQANKFSFDKYAELPKVYKWLHLAPFIFGTLSLLSAVVIVFASTNKRRGLRRVAIPLVIAGLLLVAISWFMSYSFNKAQQKINTADSLENKIAQNSVLPVLKEVEQAIAHQTVIFGIAFTVLTLSIFIYLFITKGPRPGGKKPKISLSNPDPNKPAQAEKPSATTLKIT